MRFSIITPSFRSSAWLRLCVASVADQAADAEHIVQDAGSDDGTLDWLPKDARVRAFVEKDQGMYDAVNRGIRRSTGDLLAYLNCDEQYLPGALNAVATFFAQHPETDVVFGDVVMVDGRGQYLRHRKMQTPLRYHTWTCHLSTLSCAMFFRRRVFFDLALEFNPRLRDVGDGDWMVRLLGRGLKTQTLGKFTSAFTCTGVNMSAGMNAALERGELKASAPYWARHSTPLLIAHHRLRRWLGGMYAQAPFTYEIFTEGSPDRRKLHEVNRPVSH